MADLLSTITNYCMANETIVANSIYCILCNPDNESHIKCIKTIDEQLNQFMLQLDGLTNVDKQHRKHRIQHIQSIQRVIDKVMMMENGKVISVPISELDKINYTLKEKTLEIEHVKKENARLTAENKELKNILKSINQETSDFFY